MPRITFVRHGQSHSNIGGVTMENARIPLTDLGHHQALVLAGLLPHASYVLVSPFDRARDTAAPWCRHMHHQPTVLDALREFELIDATLLEGMTGEQSRSIADAYWSQANPHERMGSRSETFAEFHTRVAGVRTAMTTWQDNTLVFGHRMWLAMLIWQEMGFLQFDSQAMRMFRRFQLGFPIPNAAVYHFNRTPDHRWTVQADEPIFRAIGQITDAGMCA